VLFPDIGGAVVETGPIPWGASEPKKTGIKLIDPGHSKDHFHYSLIGRYNNINMAD
jgi:hypothetical protein